MNPKGNSVKNMEHTSSSANSENKRKISARTRTRGFLKSKHRRFGHRHKKSKIPPQEDPFSSLVFLLTKFFIAVVSLIFGIFCLHNPEKIAHWTFSHFPLDDSTAANLNILKSIAGIIMSCGVLLPFSKFSGVAFICFGALFMATFELNIKYQYMDRRFLELGLIELLLTPFVMICFGVSVAGFLISLVEDERTKPQSSCKKMKIRDILIGILSSLFLLLCYIKIYSAEESLKNLVTMFEGPNNKLTIILLEYFVLSLSMYLVVASNALSMCMIPNFKVRSSHMKETSVKEQSAESNLDLKNKKESQPDTDMVISAQKYGVGTVGIRMRKGQEVQKEVEEDSRPITPIRGASIRRKKKIQ